MSYYSTCSPNPERPETLAKLVAYVNGKRWWHCPPRDPDAYRLRGKFFASSYQEAEFYGRPLDQSERVRIHNPVVGDEEAILTELFGSATAIAGLNEHEGERAIQARFALDTKMRARAVELGYDAIILMTPAGHAEYVHSGTIPHSLELNVLTLHE
ncbi:MAG: hypothetical protein KGJ62_01575 [Armatimonadetes bacterium]|nr:hypothetical protein [Armatimonadota bacterium]MDE2205470.1 hypothetical protein [Armatimonadota bacterium]